MTVCLYTLYICIYIYKHTYVHIHTNIYIYNIIKHFIIVESYDQALDTDCTEPMDNN